MHHSNLFLLTLVFMLAGAESLAAAPPASDESDRSQQAFDPEDPQIAALRKLKYKDIDLDKVDLETKHIAVIALSEMIGHNGLLASERLKKLNAYLAMRNWSQEYEKWSRANPLKYAPLTPEDAAKIAVAYVQTPVGHADYANRLLGVSDEVKERMFNALVANCRQEFATVQRHRRTVESIARFLESKGAFNTYLSWAEAEVAAEHKAHQEKMAALQAEADKDEAAKRKMIMQVQQQRAAQQHEERMKRMEYTYKLKEEQIEANRDVSVARNTQNYGSWNGYWGDVNRNRVVYRRY